MCSLSQFPQDDCISWLSNDEWMSAAVSPTNSSLSKQRVCPIAGLRRCFQNPCSRTYIMIQHTWLAAHQSSLDEYRTARIPLDDVTTGRSTPEMGIQLNSGLTRGRKFLQFSVNTSLYLGNGTRQSRSYYATLIGSRIFSFEPCHFRWSWVNSKDHFSTQTVLQSNLENVASIDH